MPEDSGLIGGLIGIARRVFNIPTTNSVEAGMGYERAVPPGYEEYDREAVKKQRTTEIADVKQMAGVDPRAFRIFYKLSSDATVGGCNVNVTQAPTEAEKDKAQAIIDDLWKRCKVNAYAKGWISSMLKNGDLFLSNIIDEREKKIIRLKRLDAPSMRSNMNAEGNFPENEDPYYQVNPVSEEKLVSFKAWQICQISWDKEQGEKYGHPLLGSARLPWKRLDNGEKNMVIRRAIKSGSTRHHKIGTETNPGSADMITKYKEMNKAALNDPMSAQTDIYSNGNVTVTELRGDTTLGEMADIEHFEGLISMSAGVPVAFLGGGRERGINRDVLEEQEEDYYRVVADINGAFEEGFRQIINLALWLGGINDEAITYTFAWGIKDREDADSKIARGEKLQSLGYSFETVFQVVGVEGVTYEEELERIQRQKEANIVPYGLTTKLDPIIAAMVSGQLNKQGALSPQATEQLKEATEVLQRYLSVGGRMSLPGYDEEEVDSAWMLKTQ